MRNKELQAKIDGTEAQFYNCLDRASKAIELGQLEVARGLLQYSKYFELKIQRLEAQKSYNRVYLN